MEGGVVGRDGSGGKRKLADFFVQGRAEGGVEGGGDDGSEGGGEGEHPKKPRASPVACA